MALNRPTKAELVAQLQACLSGLDDSFVVTKDSDAGIKIVMLVEAIFGLHHEAAKIEDALFVSSDTPTAMLDKHADAKLEGGRKGASVASATDGLTVSGTTGSIVAVNDALTSSDGVGYKVTIGCTLVLGAGTCSIVSTDKGSQANRDVGETLTFTAPASGVDASATVAVALEDGQDSETDAELIKRLLDAYKNPLGSGRLSDFRQWALLVSGITDAYSYGPTSDAPTGRRGVGIVDVAILGRGTGSARIPSTTLQDDCEDSIEARRPVTTKEFDVLLPTALAVDVEVEIEAAEGYEFDWDKLTGTAVAVTSYNSNTYTLIVDEAVATFATSANPPIVGDRVLISDATGNWSEMNTIKSITTDTPGAGATTIVFEGEFEDGTPAVGDEIEPAGPLTAPLLVAIRALFDGLGPARGLAYDPNQDWESDVLLAAVYQTLMNVTGVRNAEVIDIGGAVDDYAATDSAPAGVNLLVHGYLNLHPPTTT